MSTAHETTSGPGTDDGVRADLLAFVGASVKDDVTPDLDLFASGLVSSLFALQLVVHVETAFGVAVPGDELNLDNFRTVDAMTSLVGRLRGAGR